jgi:hypothetical protein
MKRRLLDYAVWGAILICATFLVTSLAFLKGAFAQEVTTGQGVICTTQDQLRRYAALYEKGQLGNVVAEKVNKEVGDETACGIALVAFVIGDKFGQVRTADGPFEVTEILIVAANLGRGWAKVQPFVQFTLIPIKEIES